jgi:hypothetical protein
LERKFGRTVQDRLASREIEHLSIFALAPMPLLIKLGTLLTDIRDIDVYQFHREPKGWSWPEDEEAIEIQVEQPSNTDGPPALVIALSATVTEDRIHRVMGDDISIWRVTIPSPTQECIRSCYDLATFCKIVRPLLNKIKAAHGHDATLSIFPSAPVSTMLELGRMRQPKADMNWLVYDEYRGGFNEAVRIQRNPD